MINRYSNLVFSALKLRVHIDTDYLTIDIFLIQNYNTNQFYIGQEYRIALSIHGQIYNVSHLDTFLIEIIYKF